MTAGWCSGATGGVLYAVDLKSGPIPTFSAPKVLLQAAGTSMGGIRRRVGLGHHARRQTRAGAQLCLHRDERRRGDVRGAELAGAGQVNFAACR